MKNVKTFIWVASMLMMCFAGGAIGWIASSYGFVPWLLSLPVSFLLGVLHSMLVGIDPQIMETVRKGLKTPNSPF